jgi:tetratricopeptide (TPR) repeat protein
MLHFALTMSQAHVLSPGAPPDSLAALDLAGRFRDLRQKAGLTKTALAKPRYTVSFVSQIESGRRRPSQEALAFFAERLGVSVPYLGTGVPEGIEDYLRYRLEEARRLLISGDLDQADRLLGSVRSQAAEYGLARAGAQATAAMGDLLLRRGNIRDAVDLLEQALEGDLPERETGMVVASLSRGYRSLGDLVYAAEVIETFLKRGGSGPLDPAVSAELQTVLVSIYFERGEVLRAERAAGRALAAAGEGAPVAIRANTYWAASRVLAEAKRWDEALEFATRARVLMEELDDRRRVARLHNAYAFICLEMDPPRVEEAAGHLQRAEDLLVEDPASGDMAYVLTERSRLALMEGRATEALEHAERALADVGGDELELARCLFLKGRALGSLDRREEAQSALREAAELFGSRGARQQEAGCWRELGELDLAAGDVQAALQALRSGLKALDPRRSRA